MSKAPSRLYFHSPCFDGIASAVLASDFVETFLDWAIEDYCPVNYRLRPTWLEEPLPEQSAVVDFLYHPRAAFWADHHSTSFLSQEVREEYDNKKTQYLAYDHKADSCAGLLWNHLKKSFDYRNNSFADLVAWADKTDGARYSSVREAIGGTAPALILNYSLAYGDDHGYSTLLVRHLRSNSLESAARLPEVQERYKRFQIDTAAG